MERFTISLNDRLAEQFDAWMAERGYANRSEAVRDLLRAELGKSRLASAGMECVACLSYVFNHHERDLAERLTSLHHEHHDLSISTMHAHLDHDHCLETAILRGPTTRVTRFSDQVCAERGVHHGNLNIISVELHASQSATAAPAKGNPAPHAHRKPAT